MIRFSCAKCGKRHRVADDVAGRKVRCGGCGHVFHAPTFVPAGDADPPRWRPLAPPPDPFAFLNPAPPVATPATISYPCPHCDVGLDVPGEHAGGEATCGACGGRTIVPDRTKSPSIAPASPGPALRVGSDPPASFSGVTTPLLISAISNLVIGVVLLCYVVGIFFLTLCYFEFRLYAKSDGYRPHAFAGHARTIGVFEIVVGLFNWFAFVCGILVVINAGKIERRADRA